MGQVLHGSATTTHAIRAAIQRSKASLQALSERYGINPKTVAKWRRRTSLEYLTDGDRVSRPTVPVGDEETPVTSSADARSYPLENCPALLQATDSPPERFALGSVNAHGD